MDQARPSRRSPRPDWATSDFSRSEFFEARPFSYACEPREKKATLTGVALACTIPLRRTFGQPEASECPLIRLEHAAAGSFRHRADLRPCAGISFAGLAPLALLGKQIGVFAFARPEGLRTCQRTRAGRSSEAIASDGIKKNS
jgi:hypothetical protein